MTAENVQQSHSEAGYDALLGDMPRVKKKKKGITGPTKVLRAASWLLPLCETQRKL